MSNHRVTSFPVALLEYVFFPVGLPLVTKAAGIAATTSILVRGGAGAGKTTLAIALAHAIARDQGGVALYLTTEFVATEVAYKASSLGLTDDMVDTWDAEQLHPRGALLAEHLVRTQAGSNEERLRTVAERKRAALEAVWELLSRGLPEIRAEREADLPVRAVVIDGFGLPEVEQEDKELRHQLVSLLQALEQVGITPILVEEAGVHAEAWLPFVVDIVFEIVRQADTETGRLHRKLVCTKSRYGRVFTGPHHYEMVARKLVISPTVGLDVLRTIEWGGKGAPAFFHPLGSNAYAVCTPGTLILSEYSEFKSPTAMVVALFRRVRGLLPMHILLGPLNTLYYDLNIGHTEIEGAEGLNLLAWLALEVFASGNANSVIIENPEYYLERPSSAALLTRAIEMMRGAGIVVCIHGREGGLGEIYNIADFAYHKRVSGRVVQRAVDPGACRADRWLFAINHAVVRQCLSLGGEFDQGILPLASADDSASDDERLAVAMSDYLLTGYVRFTGAEWAPVVSARFEVFLGEYVQAARTALTDFDVPECQLIWDACAAILTANPHAAERYLATRESISPFEFVALVRILVKLRDDRLSDTLEFAQQRFNLPEWFIARLLAEAEMDHEEWSKATPMLESLLESELPAIHRAEVFHSLATCHQKLGDAARARELFAEALTYNPKLEPARIALEA